MLYIYFGICPGAPTSSRDRIERDIGRSVDGIVEFLYCATKTPRSIRPYLQRFPPLASASPSRVLPPCDSLLHPVPPHSGFRRRASHHQDEDCPCQTRLSSDPHVLPIINSKATPVPSLRSSSRYRSRLYYSTRELDGSESLFGLSLRRAHDRKPPLSNGWSFTLFGIRAYQNRRTLKLKSTRLIEFGLVSRDNLRWIVYPVTRQCNSWDHFFNHCRTHRKKMHSFLVAWCLFFKSRSDLSESAFCNDLQQLRTRKNRSRFSRPRFDRLEFVSGDDLLFRAYTLTNFW